MLRLIELRLDNVVYRANFARTRMQSRQFVSHAHFKLNGVNVDVPSISLKVGDVIELRDKLKESPLYKNLIEELREVYDFIIRDLTEGIEGMANSSRQDKIYLSATAGKYLLSKVYLTRGKSGDYQKSIDLVDDILKSSSNFSMTIASL